FGDGTMFTAEDVAFTLKRAPNVEGSPGGYGIFTRPSKAIESGDPPTLRLSPHNPHPLMPRGPSRGPNISPSGRQKGPRARFQFGEGDDRYRPVSIRAVGTRRPDRHGAERRLLGSEAPMATGRAEADPDGFRACRRTAERRGGLD